jgi:hypothetical protein
MSVLVAKIEQSPWPELADKPCDSRFIGAGGGLLPGDHAAGWVIWTEQDTGDGMRLACGDHLGDWVESVWDRIDGQNTP